MKRPENARFVGEAAGALRTPALPTEIALSLYESDDLKTSLHSLLRDRNDIRSLIRLASGDLHDAIERWLSRAADHDEGVAASALAYVIRSATRSTPFAACAAIGPISVVPDPVDLLVAGNIQRRSRLDAAFLYSICKRLETANETSMLLRIWPSGLVYRRHGRLEIADPFRTQLVEIGDTTVASALPTSINPTPAVLLAITMCQPGMDASKLANEIASKMDVPLDAAIALVTEMIRIGIFVSELRASSHDLGSKESQSRINEISPETGGTLILGASLLSDSDKATIEGAAEIVAQASAKFANGDNPFPAFQIDSRREYRGGISNTLVDRLSILLPKLARLTEPQRRNALLADAFLNRYNEGREVGVLDLLDPVDGFRFETFAAEILPSKTRLDGELFALAVDALRDRVSSIELNDEFIERNQVSTDADLPRHAEVICHVGRDAAGMQQLLLVTGAFAGKNQSLSRFHDILPSVDFSEQHSDHVIEAEFNVVPHNRRVANVTTHPQTTDFEIICGVRPSLPESQVIRLDDIVVGVLDGRAYLRSLRLGREISVKQNHMANLSHVSRFAQFFAAVSSPSLSSFGFDWGSAALSLPALPRVSISGVTVAARSWRIPNDVARRFSTDAGRIWREKWDVPKRFYLTSYDNRLMLDASHSISLKSVEKAAAQTKSDQFVEIEECLPDFGNEICDGPHGRFFAELAISFFNSGHTPVSSLVQPALAAPPKNTLARRAFGSEWIFVKLYVGESRASYFLETVVKKMTDTLSRHFEQFHFLRFADPDFHIRLRFLQPSIELRQILQSNLVEHLERMVEEGVLDRVVYDVYDREIERYGGEASIEIAEQIFSLDSEFVLSRLFDYRNAGEGGQALILSDVCVFALSLIGTAEQCALEFKKFIGKRPKLSNAQWALARLIEEGSKVDRLVAAASALRTAVPEHLLSGVIRSLIHMHCNRSGITTAEELQVLYIMSAVYDRLIAKSRTKGVLVDV